MYDKAYEELAKKKPAAVEYLRNIDPALWTVLHYPGCRFGHLTSNVAESTNNLLLHERKLPITKVLNKIWHRAMQQRK